MKFKKKIFSSLVATATALCCIPTFASATTTPHCDVNGSGYTDWNDVVAVLQYLKGRYNVSSPEEADFDNDGFVTEVDSNKLATYLVTGNANIDAESSLSFNTNLRNCAMTYRKYSAVNGNLISSYNVPAAETLQSANSSRSTIGSDTRYTDFSHMGICKINLSDGSVRTGFVVGENLVLTAGNVFIGQYGEHLGITSIQLYNTNGTLIFTAPATNYSIPANYSKDEETDYALIKVSAEFSDDVIWDLGYALDYARYANKAVKLTGLSSASCMSTGEGILTASTSGKNQLKYNCDAAEEIAFGAPVYTDVVVNGEHHYVVIGIHTSDADDQHFYNSGVRICPNITNLIRYNN